MDKLDFENKIQDCYFKYFGSQNNSNIQILQPSISSKNNFSPKIEHFHTKKLLKFCFGISILHKKFSFILAVTYQNE